MNKSHPLGHVKEVGFYSDSNKVITEFYVK